MSSNNALQARSIGHLKEISEFFEKAGSGLGRSGVKIYDRKNNLCRKNLKPNRRDFYQVIFFQKGDGLLTMGLNTYHINKPTIAFIHPSEIISWENTGYESLGHICLFTKDFIGRHTSLKPVLDRYNLFSDSNKSVLLLSDDQSSIMTELFAKMHLEEMHPDIRSNDVLQAYLQLVVLTAVKSGRSPSTAPANNEYKHVYAFFQLLEKEIFGVDFDHPVRLRTAFEFARELSLHPNHLNALLKRYTGENISTHINRRLLEESKVLLVRTDWTLQNVGYAIGFTAQPSFSQFFKKNQGETPAAYRRNFVRGK